jgi:hypothetical protein
LGECFEDGFAGDAASVGALTLGRLSPDLTGGHAVGLEAGGQVGGCPAVVGIRSFGEPGDDGLGPQACFVAGEDGQHFVEQAWSRVLGDVLAAVGDPGQGLGLYPQLAAVLADPLRRGQVHQVGADDLPTGLGQRAVIRAEQDANTLVCAAAWKRPGLDGRRRRGWCPRTASSSPSHCSLRGTLPRWLGILQALTLFEQLIAPGGPMNLFLGAGLVAASGTALGLTLAFQPVVVPNEQSLLES